jgi:hypothetical protein
MELLLDSRHLTPGGVQSQRGQGQVVDVRVPSKRSFGSGATCRRFLPNDRSEATYGATCRQFVPNDRSEATYGARCRLLAPALSDTSLSEGVHEESVVAHPLFACQVGATLRKSLLQTRGECYRKLRNETL